MYGPTHFGEDWFAFRAAAVQRSNRHSAFPSHAVRETSGRKI